MTPTIWSLLVRCLGLGALVLVAAVAGLGAAATGGCTLSKPGVGAHRLAPGPLEMLADWDDLDAAMDVAAQRNEMAVLRASDPTGDGLIRRFELRTVAAEPVEVTVTRPEAGSGQPQPIIARAKVGRFGDPEREAALLAALRRRLEQLRGVDVSPVR